MCQDKGRGYFKIVCPGSYAGLPNKIMINRDGGIDKKYEDICQEPVHQVRIAFKPYKWTFYVTNGTMINSYECEYSEIKLIKLLGATDRHS